MLDRTLHGFKVTGLVAQHVFQGAHAHSGFHDEGALEMPSLSLLSLLCLADEPMAFLLREDLEALRFL